MWVGVGGEPEAMENDKRVSSRGGKLFRCVFPKEHYNCRVQRGAWGEGQMSGKAVRGLLR